MRSQVQVLAGPPPIPAGHSAAGSEPGAPAVSLGRVGAARPPPPARPSALPGPPTRAAGSTTTTHRGRPPSPRTAATRQARPPCAASLLPCPRAASHRRSARWPGLPGRSAGTRGRPHPTRPGRRRPPLTNARPRHRRPRPGLLGRRPSRSTAQQPTGTSTRSCGDGCPAAPAWSPTPPPGVGGDGRVRTDGGGHQPAGHRTAGHRMGWTPESWTLDGWTPAVRTAEPRTTNPGDRTPDGLDTGRLDCRIPDDDTGWVDTLDGGRGPATGAVAGVLEVPAAATTADRWMPAGGSARADAVWASNDPGRLSSTDSEGHHAATDRPGHRRDRRLRWYAAVQLAPRRTAVLGRFRVERRAARWRPSGIRGALEGWGAMDANR
jgi:hypothetical protein